MTDRPRRVTSSRYRSQSCREKSTREYLIRIIIEFFNCINITASDLRRVQRNFDRELDQSERELQWIKQRSDSFISPTECLGNVRTKINGYNQLMRVGEN
jgi:hypothetical protein